MTRKLTLVLALAAISVFGIGSANACQVVGRSSSGEPICASTSDGPGEPYKACSGVYKYVKGVGCVPPGFAVNTVTALPRSARCRTREIYCKTYPPSLH